MKKCILFAGPIGCSKTPVAVYLSWNLGLPVFNTDAIRTEVTEDKLEFIPEDEEYLKRRNERLEKLIKSGKDLILDASIDRTWPEVKKHLDRNEYQYFLINYDLSFDFWRKMSEAKSYHNSEEIFQSVFDDHEKFQIKYKEIIDLTITDENFKDRLDISLQAVKKFLIL